MQKALQFIAYFVNMAYTVYQFMQVYKKNNVAIDSQAKDCMEKQHVKLKDVLETMNEPMVFNWCGTSPTDKEKFSAHDGADVSDRIPTLSMAEREIAARRIIVTYTTSFEKQEKETIRKAKVHWVNVERPFGYGSDEDDILTFD